MLRHKLRKETKCTDVVRCDSKIRSQSKIGDFGSVRIELGNFYMEEAGPGGRRRGDQAHEGESLRILTFCTVRWKNTRIPRIQCRMGTSNFVDQRHISVHSIGWNTWRTSGIRVEEEDLGQGVPCAFPHLRQVCFSVLVHVWLLQAL